MSDAPAGGDSADGAFPIDDRTAFYGRTSVEYCRLFDLDWSELAGASVLDCPGGPGSFPAVASAVADDVIAVDPEYARPAAALAEQCEATIDRFEERLHERREDFVWGFYGDVETRMGFPRAASRRFLLDFGRSPDRYVAAALPDLPLETDAVDLALSANLLFLYGDTFDRAFHEQSIRELARVARREVRCFPLVTLAAERSELVAPVTEALRDDGLAVETREVPYEFVPGSNEIMVVSDVEGFEPGRDGD